MGNFTKKVIGCLFFLSFLSFKAQDNNLLKNFINKNDFALRSVQKNSINIASVENDANFKELLKLQIASVKLFESDSDQSAAMAYIVREKCTEFLSKNTQVSLKFFKLSDNETSFFLTKQPLKKINSYFTKGELKVINTLDVKNPNLFNDFIIRIK